MTVFNRNNLGPNRRTTAKGRFGNSSALALDATASPKCLSVTVFAGGAPDAGRGQIPCQGTSAVWHTLYAMLFAISVKHMLCIKEGGLHCLH